MQIMTLNLKEIIIDNPLFRIDAEFFLPEYMEADEILRKHEVNLLGDISQSIVNFGAYSLCNEIEFLKAGVPYLNVGDIKENWIELEQAKKIDQELSKTTLRKSLAKEGQVLLTIAGTIGNAAVAHNLPPFTNSNQAIANITLQDSVSPFFISTYLNSKFGKLQTKRLTISSVQPNLLLIQVKNIKIPFLKPNFQTVIENIYKQYYEHRIKSNALYSQAEQILLSELGLLNWKPEHRLSFVKNFSDSQTAERIDAEYFQPKYDKIITQIQKTKTGYLGDFVSIKKSIEPGSEAYQDEGIPFLRVSNLTKFGIDSGNQQYISEKLYSKLKQYQPQKGEILLSKDATPGIALFLKHEPIKTITSGGIVRLKITDSEIILPEYLTLALNSVIVQEQLERDGGGSIINHWLVDTIKKTVIPLLGMGKQKKISDLVNKSFIEREKSKQLLEIAKTGVEKAIEKDEMTADVWIKNALIKLNINL